jgi:hypothetical protein
MRIDVDCGRGPMGELVPRRIRLDRRTVAVTDVIDRWPGEGHCYVKVTGDDSGLYILRHDSGDDTWRLVMFQRRTAPAMP